MKRWYALVMLLCLAGCARGAWLSSTQSGFTADETICRIAGDKTNAAELASATGTLWQAFDAHNHDGRYDPAGAAGVVSNALLLAIGAHNHDGRYDLFGAANAVSNGLAGALAGEAAARGAFDAGLQQTNGIVLYGHDLYRETAVDGPDGWLDWRIAEIDAAPTVGAWAHWEGVVFNADGSIDDDQAPDFGASACGQFAWILDGDGNYRVPQEWHDGDRFANVGPDEAEACWCNGIGWVAGETTVGETVIDAVETGYTGSDYIGSYDEYSNCPVAWRVGDDRKEAWYAVNWQASGNGPPGAPWFVSVMPVQAQIRIRPAADLAIAWDGGCPGDVYSAGGEFLGALGSGPLDPALTLAAGAYFEYGFVDWSPSTYGEIGVYLGDDWLYGHERQYCWLQVPSGYDVTNTVLAALGGYYAKADVDGMVGAVGGELADFIGGFPDAAETIATNAAAVLAKGVQRTPVAIASALGVTLDAANGNLQCLAVVNNPCVIHAPLAADPAAVETIDLEVRSQSNNVGLHSSVLNGGGVLFPQNAAVSVTLRHGWGSTNWGVANPNVSISNVLMDFSGTWSNSTGGTVWWSASGWSGQCCRVDTVTNLCNAYGYAGFVYYTPASSMGALLDVANGNGGAFLVSPVFSNGVTSVSITSWTVYPSWQEPLVTSFSTNNGVSWVSVRTNTVQAFVSYEGAWALQQGGQFTAPINTTVPTRVRFSNPYRIVNNGLTWGDLMLNDIVVHAIR